MSTLTTKWPAGRRATNGVLEQVTGLKKTTKKTAFGVVCERQARPNTRSFFFKLCTQMRATKIRLRTSKNQTNESDVNLKFVTNYVHDMDVI